MNDGIYREFPRRGVLIGRLASNPIDEVWCFLHRGVTTLGKALRGGRNTLRTRTWWESRLVHRGRVDAKTVSTVIGHTWVAGEYAVRVFDLLVADGVLVRPTPFAYEAACTRRRCDVRWAASQKLPPIDKMWCVDKTSRDAWVSARLLLMAGDL